jgi:peptidase M28-like protein/PDZ domain-containing protein/PA domain-containing protein
MRSPRSRAALRTLLLALPLLGACISDPPELTRKKLLERVPKSALALQADVAWLSDNAREGRRAGMQGEMASADWLARQLGTIGLEPIGEEGYFQRFPVPLAARVGESAKVGKTVQLASGREAAVVQSGMIEPLFCSISGEVRGPLVFRGYGIVDEERGHDDYASGRVDGAIVMLRRGTPAADGGPWGFGGSVLHKVMTAKRNGAAAVIITQPPEDEGGLNFHDGHEANAGLPCLWVDPLQAGWLWSATGEESTAAESAAFRRLIASAEPADGPSEVMIHADVRREDGVATNVLAVLRGRGEAPTLIVGAHYDHLGLGGPGSLAPDAVGQIHNGADDNASGTAAVLEIARILKSEGPPVGDVVFALWSGEELGLLGSRHWCANPTVPLEDVSMNLNLDMVGRAESNGLEAMGVGTSPDFAGWVTESAKAAGLDAELTVSGFGVGGSDHQSFLDVGIPAVHLFTGLHDDYHKPSDDLVRFEERGTAQVVALCVDFIARAQRRGGELAFIEPPKDPNAQGGRRGFDVRFGSRPADYGETGGLTLAGVSPGTPAERAGLMAGDTLLEVGGVKIDGIQDFVYVLRTHKPGDVVKTIYLRDGNEESVLVTLDSNVVE